MSGMLWIALELSIPKIGLNIMLSLSVKKLDVFKFDGVAESDNTVCNAIVSPLVAKAIGEKAKRDTRAPNLTSTDFTYPNFN